MNKPSVKLAMAYATIAKMEARIKEFENAQSTDQQEDRVDQLRAEIERHKHNAELYDEVWGLATGLGYMNVTTAIGELRKERDQLKARNLELEELLREVVALDPRGEFLGWNLDSRIDAALSKPAVSDTEDHEDFRKVFVRSNTKLGQTITLEDMMKRYPEKP